MEHGTSDYTNSAACKLLATHCACCGRPLVDANSVERGIGPDCAAKYGYGEAQGPLVADAALKVLEGIEGLDEARKAIEHGDAHKAANVLTHRVACLGAVVEALPYTTAIECLGYTTLAAKLLDRLAKKIGGIEIKTETTPTGELLVLAGIPEIKTQAEFGAFVARLRGIPGRRWDAIRKANTFPRTQEARVALWSALKATFPAGTIVRGNKVTTL